jgi:glutamate--cysteine ligase
MTADNALVVSDRPLASVAAARELAASAALDSSEVGPVGLELEFHLVDRARPSRRISWPEIGRLLRTVPALPGDSAVTVEPGGQLELSTSPRPDVVAAVEALRRDHRRLDGVVRAAGYGLASIGTDPARVTQRVNPASRYVAMERHFDALAYGVPGRAMMSATASLQVNLNAGRPERWAERVSRLHRLGPVLVALSACSPLVAGRASGWRSMRQEIWAQLDQARCRPLRAADPAEGWARYALAAPVMLVRDFSTPATRAVTDRVPFAAWVSGQAQLGRPPTAEDLEYHLSTLFPPVRLRGYLEIRCLDAVPHRWWPALAALVVTLVDDDVAADRAAQLCAGLGDVWTTAAREGLRHPALWAAARGCAEVAAERCPPALRSEVESYAELVRRGRTPGDELRERARICGSLRLLEEVTDA